MIASLMAGGYEHARVVPLRMAYSATTSEVGLFRWHKLLHLAGLVVRTYALALRYRPVGLYYHPGGSARIGLLRDLIYLWAVRWLFSRTVLHFHAAGFEEGLSRLPRPLRSLLRLACARPDYVIRVAEASPDPGPLLQARRTRVVTNGIPDSFSAAPPKRKNSAEPRILFLGRLCEGKGVDRLVEATARLQKAGRHYRLVLAGPAESAGYENALREKIAGLGLEPHVELAGELGGEDKLKHLREADIFCLPSHYAEELLPVSIIEAMAAGLPVVATRWRGIPELVADNETGLLVEPHDAEALATALAALLDDSARCEQYGQAGRERFLAKFTEKAYHQAIDLIFAEL